MLYQKFHPCPQLGQFVECYFIWQSSNGDVKDLVVESPPNGFCSIAINLGEPYFLQNKKYERLAVPNEFIAGQSIYSYKLFLNGRISLMGIVFKPAGLASLFNLSMYEFTEERISMRKIFGEAIVANLVERLSISSEPKLNATILEDFVLQRFNEIKPTPDYIDIAVNKIVDSHGMLHVNELMENIYMSRRNFERKFFKKVGLSPKYYARIRRLGYALSMFAGQKKANWAGILNQCEFYDQSHFIKDFLEFTGRTPQQYIEENQELANLVEKPKQQSLI